MKNTWLRLHPDDNLIVALHDLPAGTCVTVEGCEVILVDEIPAKHKFTVSALGAGDAVRMYGVLVGKTTRPLPAGSRVTVDNVVHAAATYAASGEQREWTPPDVSRWRARNFLGYHRADGRVGTANYWLVIPLVFCENRNVEVIEASLSEQLGYVGKRRFAVDTELLIEAYRAGRSSEEILALDNLRTAEELAEERVFPNVDGIKFLTHDGGCGGIRQDAEVLVELLAGYISHPNVAGATVLSLGCQNAQVALLEAALERRGDSARKPVHILEQQGSESEASFIATAVKQTFVGLMQANRLERKPAPLSKLVLGLECGGSDGFSGISANPTLGYASDLLVALGGSTVLAEFPELNGVEQELIDRCTTPALADKFAQLMGSYAARAEAVGSGFENNPSPGNIKDGLITDAMKSAGAAKKGGTSPVADVLDYTEPVVRPGLNLLCTPGNDVESTTGLAGSGCNLIVFTTGLGTPTGNPVTPVVKMSSNNVIAERMRDLIDFNAGTVITGEDSPESRGEALLDYLIVVASGERTTAAQRLGQDDFIPWKRGISL